MQLIINILYQQGYIYVHIYPIKIGIGGRLCGIQLITRAPIGAWEVKLEIMTYQLTNLPTDRPTDGNTGSRISSWRERVR